MPMNSPDEFSAGRLASVVDARNTIGPEIDWPTSSAGVDVDHCHLGNLRSLSAQFAGKSIRPRFLCIVISRKVVDSRQLLAYVAESRLKAGY
jgi:hypothetical protein